MIERSASGELKVRLSTIATAYLVRQFLIAFIGILAVFLAVIFLIDLIELLRRASGKQDATFSVVLGMAIYKLPMTAQKTLPFAVLFGAMYSFWRLNRSSELVALRASGVSVWQFLLPPLGAALLIGVVKITAINPLGAIMTGHYEQLENRFLRMRSNLMAATASGVWLRQIDSSGQSVIHATSSKVEGKELELQEVMVLLYKGEDEFAGRIDAQSAKLEPGQWRLVNARMAAPDKPVRALPSYTFRTDLTIARIQDSFSSASTVSFWELPRFIRSLEATGFSALSHRLYWHSLLAEPLLYCAMVLIAAIFSLRHTRLRGVLFAVAGGIATGFLLFFLSDLVLALAHSTRLPPMLAAWAPVLASTMIGLAVLIHVEDG
ncbi:MAG: LPS export ABC transporter permease LptG [Rhodospirillaceae bacterium]|nr:LPS export ABC transporter permease LptG [Rhodospirillaceae bacterium]